MSVPWPDSLPSFDLTGWFYSRKSGIIKSEMEIGPPKRRRRTTAQMAKVSGTLSLSAAQVQTLRNFIDVELHGGIKEILWPEFVEGKPKRVVLSIDTNGDLYQITQVDDDTFKVRLTFEVLP